jgi:excisionase family DNA binding protein
MIEKPMTEQQAAEALGVSTGTLRNARKAGEIAFIRLRSLVRYREADLHDYLERQRTPCRDQPRPTDSASSISSAVQGVRTGTSRGTTAAQDRPDARALAPRILRKRSA